MLIFPIESSRFIMTNDVMTQLYEEDIKHFLFRIGRLCASNPHNTLDGFATFPKMHARLDIPDNTVNMVFRDEYFTLTLNEQKFSVRIPNIYVNMLAVIDSHIDSTNVVSYMGFHPNEIFNEVMKFIEDFWIIKS